MRRDKIVVVLPPLRTLAAYATEKKLIITRRVSGQSVVCRMVYIGMIFYMGTLSSRNTTQMAFCSSRDTT